MSNSQLGIVSHRGADSHYHCINQRAQAVQVG
jgi:hypothetical protein